MYQTQVTIDQVIDILADFITPFVPVGAEIIRAQVNRVPQPGAPCVVLTELLTTPLQMSWDEHDSTAQTTKINESKRIDIQVDFYDAQASEYCNAVKTAFRSSWGFDQFPSNLKPLYSADGIQSPMITGEQQWGNRWTLTVSLQYNPAVTVPQQSAQSLAPNLVSAADVPQV